MLDVRYALDEISTYLLRRFLQCSYRQVLHTEIYFQTLLFKQ